MHKIIEEYLTLCSNSLSPKSLKDYTKILSAFDKTVKTGPITKNNVIAYLNSGQFQRMKIGSQNTYKATIKTFLKRMNIECDYIKRRANPSNQINGEDLPTKEEVNNAINKSPSEMVKCVIASFWESGGRIKEMSNVKLKDLKNKGSCFIMYIWVSKTKSRPVPLIESVPYLISWLNNHPDKLNLNQYFFCHYYRSKLVKYTESGLRSIIKKTFKQIGKPIHPHLLRHGSITRDLINKVPPKQVCMKHGLSNTAMLDKVYAHLTSENVENSYLEIYGLQPKQSEQTVKAFTTKECPRCKLINSSSNLYCSQCGSLLDAKNALNIATALEVSKEVDKKE